MTNFAGGTGAVSIVWSAPADYVSGGMGDVTVGADCGIESAEAQITVVDVGLAHLLCSSPNISVNAGATGVLTMAVGQPGETLELSS